MPVFVWVDIALVLCAVALALWGIRAEPRQSPRLRSRDGGRLPADFDYANDEFPDQEDEAA